jgi:hypothetical protein
MLGDVLPVPDSLLSQFGSTGAVIDAVGVDRGALYADQQTGFKTGNWPRA